MEYVIRPGSADHLARDHERGYLEDLFTGGEGFLDVGAHAGRWSLALCGLYTNVIAVEPDPSALEALRANISLNGIVNIRVIEAAGWARHQILHLDTGPMLAWGRSKIAKSGVRVFGVPLDDEMLPTISAVKIDTEGAEAEVLAGLRKTLRRDHPLLVIEMHDVIYDRPEIVPRVREELELSGYVINEKRDGPEGGWWAICR